MTAVVQRELAEKVVEVFVNVLLTSRQSAVADLNVTPRQWGEEAARQLTPLIADAEKRAAAAARREQQLWDRRRVEDYAAVVGVELSPGDDTIAAVDELYRAAALDPAGAVDEAQPSATDCWCMTCEDARLKARESAGDRMATFNRHFVVCPDCGNKRCPRAAHHDRACTGSNEPGQPGSAYENVVRPSGAAEGAGR